MIVDAARTPIRKHNRATVGVRCGPAEVAREVPIPDGWAIRSLSPVIRVIWAALAESEVPSDGQPATPGSGPGELRVRNALGEGVTEVEGHIRRAEQPRRVPAVHGPPITGHEPVSRVTEEDLPIRHPGVEGVSPVEEPGGFAMQTDLVDAVTVPITGKCRRGCRTGTRSAPPPSGFRCRCW